jgi:hypothetical protein
MIIGFAWGGWMTFGTAKKMSEHAVFARSGCKTSDG